VPWLPHPARPDLQPDLVNHPPHYIDGGIECIEAIEAQLTPEEYRGYLKGNCVKYIWRERHKGNTESLKKAQWYMDRLIGFDEVNQKGVLICQDLTYCLPLHQPLVVQVEECGVEFFPAHFVGLKLGLAHGELKL